MNVFGPEDLGRMIFQGPEESWEGVTRELDSFYFCFCSLAPSKVSLYINHEQLEISGYQRDVASSR
jgi:hypothetical protein